MRIGKTASLIAWGAFMVGAVMAAPATAQTDGQPLDLSPMLLLETGPSDNPDYRRMVFVKYLSGDAVTVTYKAYNRAEFIQVPDATPEALILACVNGPATSLDDIKAFEASEAEARRQGEAPTITHFCIKNVTGWEAGNRSTYLDPIFEGLPHAATLNN